MKRFCWLGLLAVLGVAQVGQGDELPEGLLCPVSALDIDPDLHTDYRDGKIYFCCEKCRVAFAKDTARYATKANLQLVLSKQAVQKACPITGKPTKEGVQVAVAGVDVGLCCGKCQQKVKEASEADQIELVFGDEPFEKGFEVTGSDE